MRAHSNTTTTRQRQTGRPFSIRPLYPYGLGHLVTLETRDSLSNSHSTSTLESLVFDPTPLQPTRRLLRAAEHGNTRHSYARNTAREHHKNAHRFYKIPENAHHRGFNSKSLDKGDNVGLQNVPFRCSIWFCSRYWLRAIRKRARHSTSLQAMRKHKLARSAVRRHLHIQGLPRVAKVLCDQHSRLFSDEKGGRVSTHQSVSPQKVQRSGKRRKER